MDEYWLEFGKVAMAHLLAVASPGPDFAVVMRHSIGYGRKAAVWTSIGIGAAILLHVSYSLLGLGLLIKSSPIWFETFKYVAAAYIAWFGVQCLRAKRADAAVSSTMNGERAPTSIQALMTGFLTNALNPKATLFFLALFATVISPQTPRLIQAAYGAWMAVATAIWFSLVAILLTRPDVRGRFLEHSHWINRLLGIVLLGFAVSLVFSRWS
jgi:RhtB (resistance to homoserine/threonine) family protein